MLDKKKNHNPSSKEFAGHSSAIEDQIGRYRKKELKKGRTTKILATHVLK